MKQKLLNLKSWLLMMCLLVGVGQSWAEDYTIVFKTNTSDGSSTIAANANLDNVISSGKEYVSAFTSTCSKAYYASISGVKLGSSSSTGTMEFKLADNLSSVNIKSIKIVSAKYGSDTGTLTLYNGTTQLKSGITPGEDYTYTYTNPQKITSIKISTSSKRAYISSITLSTEGTTTPTEQYSYTLETVGSGTTTFKDGNGNTIEPNQKVNSGTKITPTYAPSEGFEFTSWEYYTSAGTLSRVNGSEFTITKDVKFRVTYTAVAPKAKYPVTIVTPENGTLTIMDGETVINSGDEVEEGKTLTVEVEPADGYRFKNWGYKDGDAAWVGNMTSTFTHVMPSAPCSFKATFEEIPTYTVAFSVNGSIVQSEDLKEGAAVTAPATPDDINEKTFTGWVETPNVGADEKPEYVTPSATAVKTVTYYAVFATVTDTGETGDKTITLDFVGDDWGIPVGSSNKTVDETEYSFGGYTIKLAGNTGNGFYMGTNNEKPVVLMLGKEGAYLKLPVLSTPIKKVTCLKTPNTSTSTRVKWNVFAGENAASAELTGCANGGEFVIKEEYQNSELMIRVTNANNTQFTGIEILTEGTAIAYSDFTTTPLGTGTISISSVGWGTYFTNVEFTMPNGLEGYVVTPKDETSVTLTKAFEGGQTVPASTALLVKGEGDYTYVITNTDATFTGENCLHGNLVAGSVAEVEGASKYYKLLNGSKGLGWYLGAQDGGVFSLGANKAYLALTEAQANGAKALSLSLEETTGIESINADVESTRAYNLAGQRVKANHKGIVIVNGKKMLNK
ncbi:MAG: hypothetical protein MJZ29_04215 [Bacteroidaceae bacterium]|nr:hypothetical protein [Bacteroidaceae bacterium]